MTAIAPERPYPGLADYSLLLLLAALWGGSFTFIKIGVETVPSLTLTAMRLVIATATLLLFARLAGERVIPDRRLWPAVLAAGITGNALPFALISWGEEHIDSGLAAILMGVMPLATVIIAHFVTSDEKLDLRKIVGVLLGLAGLVVLIGPEKLLTLGGDVPRQLAVAGASLCYAVNANITRTLTRAPPRGTVAAVLLVSTVIMVPISLLVDRPMSLSPSLASMLSIVTLGIVQTGIATLMLFEIVRRQGASFFSQINYLVPIAGVVWGAIVLGERVPPSAYAALALILLGVAIAKRRRAKR
ncbi:MAG: DMT family transporter [Hyphomicrobiaceae bacterium]